MDKENDDDDLRGIRYCINEAVEHLKPLADKNSTFNEDDFTKEFSDVERAVSECMNAYNAYIQKKS